MSVFDIHKVIGGKMNAPTSRTVGRDLFDANSILDTPGLNQRRIRLAATDHETKDSCTMSSLETDAGFEHLILQICERSSSAVR